jgi:hypothetical protein
VSRQETPGVSSAHVLPWWAYLVAAVVGLVVLLRLAQRSFRSSTRRELLDLLRDDRELKVVSESPDALVLEGASEPPSR